MADASRSIRTDVLVVGAGPGGSAAAYYLARHGIDVTLIDRAAFPREKVCGDGLTPRSVRALLRMGIDTSAPGFEKVVGLRVYSRSTTLELRWPKLRDFPDYGVAMTRHDFDEILVRRAERAGARLLERTEAVSPIEREGWVEGVLARPAEERNADPFEIRARFVLAADGAPSRLGSAVGVRRDPARPLGIAARRYYRIERSPGPWFESWLDLWEGDELLPAYGWLFPLADGAVNLGAGLLNTFKGFKEVSAQRLFDAFTRQLPVGWGICEETALGPVRSGPLPMGASRRPAAVPGMLLIGDAAGFVNPFNGEGIAYAMESAEIAAELVHDALVSGRPGRAQMYPTVLAERYGRYYTMGRVFARAIGRPAIMQASTRFLLPNEPIMRFAMRMLANLTDGPDGDTQDRLFAAIQRLAPAA